MAITFKVLFDEAGNAADANSIKKELSIFSKSYDRVVKIIIENSERLNRNNFRNIFNFNIATLMPSFGMTRTDKSAFYGMGIKKGVPIDSKYKVLDAIWKQFGTELEHLKKHICKNISLRNRAILELKEDTRKYAIATASELFDELEWTTIRGIDIGRVGASKILFAVFPEFALPVDNAEWDYVFRTHNYGRVLLTMIEEIKEWEKVKQENLETLSVYPKSTLPSIYNVMAMSARARSKKAVLQTK